MGIPSYYKKLSDKVKGLIQHSRPSNVKHLYFDFNCLIYHCARRTNTSLPPYPGDQGKEEWEALLIQDICKYVEFVWREAGQPQNVFLSIDGVVPMAKIKQQRHRRFKSIWQHKQEPSAKPTWDTNCITPGTSFMKRLSASLDQLAKKHRGWRFSSDLEPGEGEHKIMNLLRTEKPEGPILVYGLDADLILLTMLNSPCEAFLMREDSEMGGTVVNIFGEESFSYFSLNVLKSSLWGTDTVEYNEVLEYVTAMTLLGNDFLPHSLTIKIREDGHQFLLQQLRELKTMNLSLLKFEDALWKINYESLLVLMEKWSKMESDRILHMSKKKIQMRGRVEMNSETMPLEHPVEFLIVNVREKEWWLREGWQDIYSEKWLYCKDRFDIEKCCREYLFGLQWVLDYYTGQRKVDPLWYYPRLIPPLWTHLFKYLSEKKEIPQTKESTLDPIRPEEQLAMVLPLESWHHIPQNSSLRSLPSLFPQFWPQSFGFFTAGRIRTWECEPLIPLLPVQIVREIK